MFIPPLDPPEERAEEEIQEEEIQEEENEENQENEETEKSITGESEKKEPSVKPDQSTAAVSSKVPEETEQSVIDQE